MLRDVQPVRALLFLCGEPDEVVASEHGSFDRWFREASGPAFTWTVQDVRTEPVHPAVLDRHDVLVISGSPHAAYEPHPWIPDVENVIVHAVRVRGMPVLGVCFGHQLLARSCGGRVVRNPRGREIGTVRIERTTIGRGHPWLDGLDADAFEANVTHCDTVIDPPPDALVLATSERDDCQAFVIGSALGVQFHPEITGPVMASYVKARHEILRREDLDPDAILAGVRNPPTGKAIFAQLAARAQRTGAARGG